MGMHTSGSRMGVLHGDRDSLEGLCQGETSSVTALLTGEMIMCRGRFTSVRHSPASYCFSFINSLSR